mmetsp:Transcript_147437/g.456094  ORF Transcript_147437/g.456094 Transcript_147437/m.456094 type:complete len:169 (+) Transcript_147437:85-591(+)
MVTSAPVVTASPAMVAPPTMATAMGASVPTAVFRAGPTTMPSLSQAQGPCAAAVAAPVRYQLQQPAIAALGSQQRQGVQQLPQRPLQQLQQLQELQRLLQQQQLPHRLLPDGESPAPASPSQHGAAETAGDLKEAALLQQPLSWEHAQGVALTPGGHAGEDGSAQVTP